MTVTIGLDDLIRDIMEHLGEADAKYRAWVADRLSADYNDDGDVLKGIEEILMDPNTRGGTITDLASELLSQTYTYDGDSLVSVGRAAGFSL